MRLRSLWFAMVVLVIAGCTGESREIQFFNSTIKWVYQCLPVGETFEVKGTWSGGYLPIQKFTTQYVEGDQIVAPHYLEVNLDVPSESQADFYVAKLAPLTNLGLVYLGHFKGGDQYSGTGPTILGVWDFDKQYALIETYPGYSIPAAKPIELCDYLAPKRLQQGQLKK